MFPGPAQRKQIDNIGQIFSGFLSTCFLGPNPSNIWMFEKWKQHCWQVFFACLFLVRSPQNKPKQLYYVAQFPMTSPPKKLYIIYIYIYYIIFIYTLYYFMLHIYIYICSIFLPQIFPRPAVQKNKHICSIFPQPALPSQPKKNKHTFCSFFCHRFARGQPSKKYKFEKHTTYIFVSVFFPLIFPPPALKKI